MKHVKQWLVAGLALGMAALTASMPAQADFLVQGVQVLDTDANVYLTLDANLLNTLEGTTTASYTALVTAIIAANNGGTVADTPDYFDGDSKKHAVTAADFQTGGYADYWGALGDVAKQSNQGAVGGLA